MYAERCIDIDVTIHSSIKLTVTQFTPAAEAFEARRIAIYDTRLISCTIRPRTAIWLNMRTGMTSIISFVNTCRRGCGSRRGGCCCCVCCRPVSINAELIRRTYVMWTARNVDNIAMLALSLAILTLLDTFTIRSGVVTHIT